MNGQLVLLSDNLSSVTPGMELKEVCFPSQPAFPKCPLQTNPCASTPLWTHLKTKPSWLEAPGPSGEHADSEAWNGLFHTGESAHSFHSTLFTPDLRVYRSVSLVHSALLVSLRQLLYFVRLYTHTHTWFAYSKRNSGFFLQLSFLKLIQPKQQSQVSWVAGKTGK